MLGVRLAPASVTLLLEYLDRLYAWNASAGLTSVERADAARLHLLDSLSVARFLPANGSLVDLGSGAGLPGLPVAVALPSASVTLVETKRKKVSFLTETIRELGIANCEIAHADARTLAPAGRVFDVVMARAFLPPAELVAVGSQLVGAGGRILVMGARRDLQAPSLAAAYGLVCTVDERFRLPGGDENRRVLVLTKTDANSQSR